MRACIESYGNHALFTPLAPQPELPAWLAQQWSSVPVPPGPPEGDEEPDDEPDPEGLFGPETEEGEA